MPRTAVMTKTLYQFAELDEVAKERAREWWRECEAQEFDPEYDDYNTVAKILGITIDTRDVPLMSGKTRQDPDIQYTGFWSQGDGARFTGDYTCAKDAPEKIREYAPQDEILHAIADSLMQLQGKHLGLLTGSIRPSQYGGNHVHSGTMVVDIGRSDDPTGLLPVNEYDEPDISEADETELEQLMRRFADWIYRQLNADYDYRMTKENVDEALLANAYEFDEEGRIS